MAKVIGIGACGNKAVSDLIKSELIKKEDALMFNSTERDFPVDFKDICVKVGSGLGGCGKERKKGKQIFIDAIKEDKIDYLDDFIKTDDVIYIITSSEGGTGSGAAPIVAKYYKEVYQMEVHIVVFTGFEDDVRGLSNTIEFFQDMDDDIIVHAISNKKFLKDTKGNKLKAEKMANRHLVNMLTVLFGTTIVDSDQNIDETDLFKVVNTPGYSIVETAIIGRDIKNHSDFNALISDTLDNSKAIDIEDASAKRIAIIMNISEKNRDMIDFSFDAIKSKVGTPYELFIHVQDEEGNEYVSMIITGLDMPTSELIEIYEKYTETANKVNTKKDMFYDSIKGMSTGNEMFDLTDKHKSPKRSKADFLSNISNKKEETDGEVIVNSKTAFMNKY